MLAGSIGSSLATTMWERQEALHHVRLTESINPFNPAAQHGLDQLTQMGLSPEQAKVWVANEITRQGFLLGFNELFWLASIAFIGLAWELVWLSTPRSTRKSGRRTHGTTNEMPEKDGSAPGGHP